MSGAEKRLNRAYNDAESVPLDSRSKFIIMSDCHRGQGNTGDNFLQNRTLYLAALEYYSRNGFVYIEAGDGDELWENRKIQPIIAVHSDAFKLMSRLYDSNRMYMLYGNHDIIKKRRGVTDKEYKSFYCDGDECRLFPGIKMRESIILQSRETGREILIVHGHQASFLNSVAWPAARFLIRYFWRPLELVGFTAPTGAARPRKMKEAVEKKLASYAFSHKIMLIAGHTHRPAYPAPGKGFYFNAGSCIHPHSITGIEIENGEISLVKWSVSVRENLDLYVNRQILGGPDKIEDFFLK